MLFGCLPPPAPNFWNLEIKFLLCKSILHPIFRIWKKKKKNSLWKFWSFKNNFEVVVNNNLFDPSLGDKKTIIPCSFDSENLKKKNPPTCTHSKKVVEDNQTFIFRGPYGNHN